MVSAVREFQLLLLAALLIGGCATKAWRSLGAGSSGTGVSPTGLFPLLMRRPAAIALCVAELALGAGLLLTAGQLAASQLALAIRCATALLFGTAVAVLHELRTRRPDAGCGCFGDFSSAPIGWRALARAVLLCAAALSTIGVAAVRLPATKGQAVLALTAVLVELAVIAALSPEVGELMVRLGYAEPCEIREIPVARTLAGLRASGPWRRYRRYLASTEPGDVWREGCWRFVVYPAMVGGRSADVVFAVYLQQRRPPVRVGISYHRTSVLALDLAIPAQLTMAPAGQPPVPLPGPTSGAAVSSATGV